MAMRMSGTGGTAVGSARAKHLAVTRASPRWRPAARVMLLALVLAGLGCGVADGESALGGGPVGEVARALTTATASMGTARYDHAALRLLDGRVLVVGGMSVQNGGVPLASAEIFDPASGTWRATGSMAVGRHDPEAVRLADGRVLVMGGVGPAVGWTGESPPVLKSAEIFEPSTGTWSKVADMSVPRFGHSALRLRDGRVLVVGSSSGSVGQSSGELFDPATGSWSLTGRNATRRMQAGLIELDDGRVLVVGGTVVSCSCEVWSPVHGTWTGVGSTSAGRDRKSLVLARLAGGRVPVAGNNFGDRSSEIFDPATGLWRGTGALNEPHYYGVGVQLDNGAVVFGGKSVWGSPTARLERYDVASETWSVVGALGSARSAPVGAPLADGGALFTGGHVYSNGASGTPVGVATVDRLPPLSDSPGGAGASCALSVATVEAAPRGASPTISVNASPGRPWSLTGLPAWATVLPASGVGSGSFTLTVAPNTGLARSATLRALRHLARARSDQRAHDRGTERGPPRPRVLGRWGVLRHGHACRRTRGHRAGAQCAQYDRKQLQRWRLRSTPCRRID